MGLEDPPKWEVPIIARTVRNRLAELGRELPIDQYRCFGWSHSSDKAWWGRMTAYVLQRWGAELKSIRLYEAIRATQYGLPVHVLHFLGLMELYNPDTNTFVTRNGELGLPFHEMHKVSGLQFGDIPYQEYFPSNQELQKLKTHKPARYDTLWELTCHYQIALAGANPVARKKSPQISLKQFSCYLFKNLEKTGEAICELKPLARSEIVKLIKKCDARSYTIASAQDRFCTGTKFRTFLLQAEKSIHPKTLLAGYIALWLKKCVVPYQTSDALPIEVLFPAVQLAHGRSLSLLPAMIVGIHRGLRQLTTTFTQTEEIPSVKIPMPKTEFPYTYLMGWLVLHRPDLMSPPKSADLSTPLLQLYEECKWPTRTFSDIRKSLHMHKG
ncbi:uncharacterized protein A4U43_C09F7150 [Asparagus officinalis]|uniref:Aminotransferase-like plant mobile domain-containing protein n=1 Tax=Asparagus officinalis TaxID=4686 RepID=A0A5P1E974_ASPOF|nr:uncharacterized protein A4U43_C09F7150 [Asparagus officinalis]